MVIICFILSKLEFKIQTKLSILGELLTIWILSYIIYPNKYKFSLDIVLNTLKFLSISFEFSFISLWSFLLFLSIISFHFWLLLLHCWALSLNLWDATVFWSVAITMNGKIHELIVALVFNYNRFFRFSPKRLCLLNLISDFKVLPNWVLSSINWILNFFNFVQLGLNWIKLWSHGSN